jgi:lysozyme family protein
MAPTYGSRWPTYAKQWDALVLVAARTKEIQTTAKNIVAAKDRYAAVEKVTGVPWYWIGPTHVRESGQDWKASLAQGDRWDRVSVHVPAGRGPFASWEAAAIDALQLDGLTRVIDWRLEKLLYYWELYNGWGYYAHGVPSPYVWGATNAQKPGKYVRDGVWSSTTMDVQLGCAAMLRAIMDLDATVKPVRET